MRRLFRPSGTLPTLLLSVWIAACGTTSEESSAALHSDGDRNPRWAVPLEKPGLPNLHRVAPGIYRGAQPKPEGFKTLKAMGVKTIINLRQFHSDVNEMKSVGMDRAFRYYDMGMNTLDMTDERAVSFLSIVENEEYLPVFYHCRHGADRTGTMSAVYRISHQGWTQDEALDEMQHGGYGYHEVWTNLIKYLNGYRVDRIRTLKKTVPKPVPRETP